MHHIYIHKTLGYCKTNAHLCFIWNCKIKKKWFCCVFFPISSILNLVLDFVCISFIGTKKISNTKHPMTFHTKRKFVHTNVIAFTPWMTIKSRIHAIHTMRRNTTFLHCKKLKNNLAIVGRTWTFLISNCSRFCKFSYGARFQQNKQKKE